MTPLDLLRTARRSIAASDPIPPAEADCRRAVSSAYYAMFHCLAADCANLLIGQDSSVRRQDAWRLVYRALEHGPARERCRNGDRMKGFPRGIRNFANTFATLQDRRHDADYDPSAWPSPAVAEGSIVEAADAINALQSAPNRTAARSAPMSCSATGDSATAACSARPSRMPFGTSAQ